MNDKYVVEYNAVSDNWNIDTLNQSLKNNVEVFFNGTKSTYMTLFIGSTYDESLDAMNLLKEARVKIDLREELLKKVIPFPNKKS